MKCLILLVVADKVIDNLLAEGKAQPMILVFPNGNSSMTASQVAEFAGEGAGAGVPRVMELLQGRPAARLQLAAALVVVAVEGLIVGERLLRMTCSKTSSL